MHNYVSISTIKSFVMGSDSENEGYSFEDQLVENVPDFPSDTDLKRDVCNDGFDHDNEVADAEYTREEENKRCVNST